MPPQSPIFTPGQQPVAQNSGQYEFIVNAGNRKQNSIFGSVTSFKSRVLLVAGGSALLLTLIWIFFAVLSNAGSANTTALITIVQRQTELARISQLSASTGSQPTQDFAATTNLSLLSERQIFMAFMAKYGISPPNKLVQGLQNAQTDAQLKAAQTNGNYDQTFVTIAQTQLTAYAKTLQQTYMGAKNVTERKLLKAAYDQAQLLLAQSTQTE